MLLSCSLPLLFARSLVFGSIPMAAREGYELRIEQLEVELRGMQEARLDLQGQMNAAIGSSLQRQLELLKKQR